MKKIIVFLLTIIICVSTLTPDMQCLADGVSFDETSVVDDLSNINLSSIIETDNNNVQLINFVEYCYSNDSDNMQNYGLYIYLYNPAKVNYISGQALFPKAYDSSGNPTSYKYYNLVLLSISSDKLYLKFKVSNAIEIVKKLNLTSRIYYISGVQLYESDVGSHDIGIGLKYTYTGFAKGYGSDTTAESSLKCTKQQFLTLTLDVKQTYYRTESSSLGKYHQNNVSSVYFSVPDWVISNYGNLSGIKANWYEYKSNYMLCTNNQDYYNAFNSVLGIDTLASNYSCNYGFATNYVHTYAPTVISADKTYNCSNKVNSKNNINCLYYCYYNNVSDLNDFYMSRESIANTIYKYKKTSLIDNWEYSAYYNVSNLYYPKILFADSVDSGRQIGYNERSFSINNSSDYLNLKDYSSSNNWFQKFLDYGFNAPDTNDAISNITPIYKVCDSDFKLDLENTNVAASDETKLLVNTHDLLNFYNDYKINKSNKETTFLFRFAATDYYSEPCTVLTPKLSEYNTSAFIAQETFFLNFDVIDLTFTSTAGSDTVVPVAADPIDVIGAITPPITGDSTEGCQSDLNIWQIIALLLGVIALFLFLKFLFPAISFILNIIFYIISLPFKIGRNSHKRKRK